MRNRTLEEDSHMATTDSRKGISDEQQQELDQAFERARTALAVIETYDQARVDRLCQAVAWAVANKRTFTRLVEMGIEESGLGDAVSRMGKRMKIRGVLRDALRQKSVGVIEEIPDKGIVKYGKPAGILACIVPTTNPDLTPAGNAIYAIKARDVVIFSPHPRSKKTSFETVRLMREALEREGAPADILQCLTKVNIPMSQALMARADLVLATGGQPMVRAAYSSGTPAYGVGAGNSTMIIDETANIEEAARNTRLSKTSDFGSGCSADGNLIIEASVFDAMVKQLQLEGGYLASEQEKAALKRAMWDAEGHRTPNTVAIAPQQLARIAGFSIPADRKFIFVHGDGIGKEHLFSSEKLTTLLAVYKYSGFDQGLAMMRAIYEVGGKGHSCGIYSFDQEHIHRLALAAPVSRIMVRQPQSKANAGAFNNGMPMTSSLGCGTWGGNIVSENVHLKHYMNTTWVSVPIKEDRPSDEELFGSFYDPELEAEVETITT
jgi:acyl-CoA reductase-like NAD-dependent aldehyde dehydrogenase